MNHAMSNTTRIELTESIRNELRRRRKSYHVNGINCTAHELSIIIGKNRAWMSQIETGRLRYIRYSDLMLVFNALYGDNAESELKEFSELFAIDKSEVVQPINSIRRNPSPTNKSRHNCHWCADLNSESNRIKVSEIYIYGAGYYNFHAPIIYCPACGKKLKRHT